jgi:hypothetical protein
MKRFFALRNQLRWELNRDRNPTSAKEDTAIFFVPDQQMLLMAIAATEDLKWRSSEGIDELCSRQNLTYAAQDSLDDTVDFEQMEGLLCIYQNGTCLPMVDNGHLPLEGRSGKIMSGV